MRVRISQGGGGGGGAGSSTIQISLFDDRKIATGTILSE